MTAGVARRRMSPRMDLAGQSFRRIEQGARRDYGQRVFWKPGKTAPERGPDLGAAVR